MGTPAGGVGVVAPPSGCGQIRGWASRVRPAHPIGVCIFNDNWYRSQIAVLHSEDGKVAEGRGQPDIRSQKAILSLISGNVNSSMCIVESQCNIGKIIVLCALNVHKKASCVCGIPYHLRKLYIDLLDSSGKIIMGSRRKLIGGITNGHYNFDM